MTIDEAAAYVGRSRATIYEWKKLGLLTLTRGNDNRYQVDPSELSRVMEARGIKPTGAPPDSVNDAVRPASDPTLTNVRSRQSADVDRQVTETSTSDSRERWYQDQITAIRDECRDQVATTRQEYRDQIQRLQEEAQALRDDNRALMALMEKQILLVTDQRPHDQGRVASSKTTEEESQKPKKATKGKKGRAGEGKRKKGRKGRKKKK